LVLGKRLADWASDFPSEGDLGIAGMLHRAGPPDAHTPPEFWGHRHVIERSTSEVVGGIGFKGPPEDGIAEIGYGIVPSRQRRGYATEAVLALVGAGWQHSALVAVIAHTEPGNTASQTVLERAGFRLEDVGELRRYRIDAPRPVR
jgi:[ribosomal protein S5]-alanine N-acetyltransferase